ncbi:MAG: intradiol ring-cleavage dioxygenase [Burkholderiaceae bacterium]
MSPRRGGGSPAARMRRRTLAAFAALGSVTLPLRGRAASEATPAMTEGPFYPERFASGPSRSLRAPGLVAGEPLLLEGRVGDANGAPLAGVRVEIWQCDALGRYRHSRDTARGPHDPGFAGFGWITTDARGGYAFETIRPVPYPGRTPHIHMAIDAPGRRLVTQVFVAGEPGNASDMLYRMLGQRARERLTVALRGAQTGWAARFDVVLAA